MSERKKKKRKKKAKKREEEKPERCADATPLREATKIQKKHSETGDPISTAEKDFFFFSFKKKKKIFLCDSLVGCSILDFFLLKKEKKKRIRAFAKLQLKLWLNKNWTQLTTVTRIGFFQPGKEVNSN